MTTDLARSPSRPTARRSAATSGSLDDLTWRIGALWSVEPQVSPTLRERLIEELHQLDVDVERLVLRTNCDNTVATAEIRSCQQRYLWLRERWAVPSPEGRAA
jgi:hypothetical protein